MDYNITCDHCLHKYSKQYGWCPSCGKSQKLKLEAELREERDYWRALAEKYDHKIHKHESEIAELRAERDEYKLLAEGYDQENHKQQLQIMDLREEKDKWKRRALYAKKKYHRVLMLKKFLEIWFLK